MFGEGFELQRVKRVLSASDVLHSVFSPAALAEETEEDTEGMKEGGGERGEGVHRQNERKVEMMIGVNHIKLRL